MKPKAKRSNERALHSSVELACPFCGQLGSVAIDEGGGEHQTFVEDCSVCCRPLVVHLDSTTVVKGGHPRIWIERDDGL
ncbi:MAG TPA: CPXCG motif-containing cysteine-rich protein [Polyangiaceae bacterium]|jgi:uncharacterized Zn-finger protein